MKGQGLVEYAVILLLIAVIVIVIVAVIAPGFAKSLSGNPCLLAETSVDCRKAKVEQCMQDEAYTKDQCVRLVGGS